MGQILKFKSKKQDKQVIARVKTKDDNVHIEMSAENVVISRKTALDFALMLLAAVKVTSKSSEEL